MENKNNMPKRLAMYLAGLFMMTIGVAISVKSDLGVSPISTIPYMMTCIWGIEMGKATIIFHCILVVIQILLLREMFKVKDLLQVVIGIIFGFFTTFCNWGVSFLPDPQSMGLKVFMMVISAAFIAFGVFLYMPPDIVLLAGEGTVNAAAQVTGVKFHKLKVGFDVSMAIISTVFCLVFIKSFGSVGIGTVIAAILVGNILGFFTKHLGHYRDRWLGNEHKEKVDKLAEANV